MHKGSWCHLAKYDLIHQDRCTGNKFIFTYLLSKEIFHRNLKIGIVKFQFYY